MEEQKTDSNSDPEVLTSAFSSVWQMLQFYGWYLVFGVIVLSIIWTNFGPRLKQWLDKSQHEHQNHHKDPDLVLARQEALERARRQLQEQQDILAARHAEKMREREEEKRRDKIEKWEGLQQGQGRQIGQERQFTQPTDRERTRSSNSSESRLRGNYNPLTGAGGGAGYRPSRREQFGGG
ncbi:selenoprotein S-like [Limulus polyphemus]|uniref:Selenoprotein S-like n=1 Tax=Limulus polyphemus TaxID=6850 RepID=A0ABM1BSV2_LIMPO|nr:selenoprotein S-like [Limulus polyphemus]